MPRTDRTIRTIYTRLFTAFGPQHWWPAHSPTEVVVGAILTQNTAWTNVERAIANLKAKLPAQAPNPGPTNPQPKLRRNQSTHAAPGDRNATLRAHRTGEHVNDRLTWHALRAISEPELAELIRPAGSFRVKAKRLKAFVDFLWTHHDGDLADLLDGPIDEVRRRLLSIHGVGPETADAILLYAGRRTSFVVDAYTKRVLRRHYVIGDDATYEEVRALFQRALPNDVQMYNEYHALLVELGKRYCRKSAQCEGCPLARLPHDAEL